MLRKLVVAAIGVAVLVLTPYFLFERGRPDGFAFDAVELRGAVEGTWRIELRPPDGTARSVSFTIEQARAPAGAPAGTHSSRDRDRDWIRPAAACGHRTLVRSAEACLDVTEMALTLVAIDGDRPQRLSGNLTVTGTRFERARLGLQFDQDAVAATISSAGEVLTLSGAVKLERLQPRR